MRINEAGRGSVRQGLEWFGRAGQVAAMSGWVWRGVARLGLARIGKANISVDL